jgi:hypothetical protein
VLRVVLLVLRAVPLAALLVLPAVRVVLPAALLVLPAVRQVRPVARELLAVRAVPLGQPGAAARLREEPAARPEQPAEAPGPLPRPPVAARSGGVERPSPCCRPMEAWWRSPARPPTSRCAAGRTGVWSPMH